MKSSNRVFKSTNNSKFNIKVFFKGFDKIRWMYFVALFFFTITACFIIKDFVSAIQSNQSAFNPGDPKKGTSTPTTTPYNGWVSIDKFTYQSNVLLLVYSFFIVFFPKHQFLRGNKFLISTMVYIFFTFVGYNFILTFTSGGYTGDSYAIGSSVWEHFICPVLFIVIGFVKMALDPMSKIKKYWTTLIPGMIYPTAYVIYVASIPFVYNNGPDSTYSVYGFATNTKDNPTVAWPVIVCMYVIFFPGSFAIFYYSYKAFQKQYIKKNHL